MRKSILSLIAAGLLSGCEKERSLDQAVDIIILGGPCVSEKYTLNNYMFELEVEDDLLGKKAYHFICTDRYSSQVDQRINKGDEVQVGIPLNQRGSPNPISISSSQIYGIAKKP